MNVKDLVGKAYSAPAFIDLASSGAKDMAEFQEVVELAVSAEAKGYLTSVYVHRVPGSELYDLLYLTGSTDAGPELLAET